MSCGSHATELPSILSQFPLSPRVTKKLSQYGISPRSLSQTAWRPNESIFRNSPYLFLRPNDSQELSVSSSWQDQKIPMVSPRRESSSLGFVQVSGKGVASPMQGIHGRPASQMQNEGKSEMEKDAVEVKDRIARFTLTNSSSLPQQQFQRSYTTLTKSYLGNRSSTSQRPRQRPLGFSPEVCRFPVILNDVNSPRRKNITENKLDSHPYRCNLKHGSSIAEKEQLISTHVEAEDNPDILNTPRSRNERCSAYQELVQSNQVLLLSRDPTLLNINKNKDKSDKNRNTNAPITEQCASSSLQIAHSNTNSPTKSHSTDSPRQQKQDQTTIETTKNRSPQSEALENKEYEGKKLSSFDTDTNAKTKFNSDTFDVNITAGELLEAGSGSGGGLILKINYESDHEKVDESPDSSSDDYSVAVCPGSADSGMYSGNSGDTDGQLGNSSPEKKESLDDEVYKNTPRGGGVKFKNLKDMNISGELDIDYTAAENVDVPTEDISPVSDIVDNDRTCQDDSDVDKDAGCADSEGVKHICKS